LLALAAGLIVWLVIGTLTHNREAWDAPAYLWLGVPTLALSTATLAFFFPAHPYRIGVLPMGAQAVWAYATEPWGPFGPVGLFFFALYSLPCILTAIFGAKIGLWHQRRALER